MNAPHGATAIPSTPELVNPIDPGLFAADNTIAVDLSCRRCSYNLRGLPGQGRCPECGTAVGLSTFGNFLRFADPDWVEKIAYGALLVLWGIVVQILGNCFGGAATGTMRGQGGVPWTELISLASAVLGIIGQWVLTTPDPGTVGEDKVALARTITRTAVIINFAFAIVTLGLEYEGLPPVGEVAMGILGALGAIAGLTSQYFFMVYVEHLFTRVPDDRLVSRTRTLRWGYVISLGLLLAAALLLGLNALGGKVPDAVMIVPAAIGGILIVICSLLFILVLLRLRKALRLQAESARAGWAARQWQPPAAPIAT